MLKGERINRPARGCACGDHVFASTSAWGVVLVSPQDRPLVDEFAWTLTAALAGTAYAYSERFADERCSSRYLHRAVLTPPTGNVVDHINRNGLDCRRSNLRAASHKDNIRNASLTRRSDTGLKGVGYSQSRGKYRARIMIDGRDHHLGYFANAAEAGRAYDAAARAHFGQFASTNFTEASRASA